MDSSTKCQVDSDAVDLLIEEYGIENMEARLKSLKKKKKKEVSLGVNFPVRMPRDVLDWYKHYFRPFGQTAATRFMAKVLVEYAEEYMDRYPMLETFGKAVDTAAKRGRKKKEEGNGSAESHHSGSDRVEFHKLPL